MKRLTYLALPAVVLLLFLSVMDVPSNAQTGEKTVSWSNDELEIETEAETTTADETAVEAETETTADAETETTADAGTETTADAETETMADAETETTADAETETTADAETEATAAAETEDITDEEIPQPNLKIASPSNALIATLANAAPIEITEIENDKYIANCIQLLIQGHSSASLDLPQLDGTINFYREGAAFAEKNVRYSVSYKTEDFDDTYGEQTGLFSLKASILLEDERYVIAPEVSTDIFIPIFIYDPEQPSFLPPPDPDLNTHDDMETFHLVTDVHTDLQQVEAMLIKNFPYKRFYINFENGFYLNLPNTWDLNSVKAGVPGIYPAYRRPELPQGVLMEDIPEAVCSINIQDSKAFTLSSPISFGNNIVITWLYPTPEPSLFRLRYRIGQGDWIADTDEYYMRLHSDENGRLSLFLNPWEMKKDIHYQFQLEYNGVYSDILKLCVNEDGFYIPNEGDEDGGDRDNQIPPDVIQPAPEPSEPEGSPEVGSSGSGSHSSSITRQSSAPRESYRPGYRMQPVPESAAPTDTETKPDNRSAADPVAAISGQAAGSGIQPSIPPSAEADTSTASVWSGRRIQQYLKVSPQLPLIFEKDLIRVAIPAGSPAFSALSDSDSLHVEIQALSADTLRLTASLNEIPLAGIPMTVTMPWSEDDRPENLQVKEEAGEWIGTVDKITPECSITFTVTQSGVYTIMPSVQKESAMEKERKSAAQPAIEPVIPGILILGSISAIVFLKYKRKKD